MKNRIIFLALFFFPCVIYAQDKSDMAELKIGVYTIKVAANADKTYGFEIYNQQLNKSVLQQKNKPYTLNKIGFAERQNAIVAAIWFIYELKEGRNDIKKLTLAKAKELGITQKDL